MPKPHSTFHDVAVVALLARVESAVSARLDQAFRRAAVAALDLAVVALFTRIESAVAAGFEPAFRRATVAVRDVAVVALFARVQSAVAARLEPTRRRAAVAGGGVAVVALLLELDATVAAARDHAHVIEAHARPERRIARREVAGHRAHVEPAPGWRIAERRRRARSAWVAGMRGRHTDRSPAARTPRGALRDEIERAINTEVRRREYLAPGLDVATIRQVERTYAPFADLNPKKEAGKGGKHGGRDPAGAPSGFVYLLWVAIFSIVQMLLGNTIEEKSNKIIEVLLSSATPGELMTGKLVGIAAIGLTIVGTWFASLLGILYWKAGSQFELGQQLFTVLRTSNLLPAFVFYFLFGYLMYAAVFMAIGSVCNTLKDAQNFMGGATLLLMVPMDWDAAPLRLALAFPDIYELGMSNLGLATLYDILNRRAGILCERVYCPWSDMEAVMRREGLPLYSLETHHPLSEFDLIGISLPYEQLYSNVLNLLDLGGVPVMAADRDATHPIVLAGGHATYNPDPMADFVDAFAIGEGEEVIVEVARCIEQWKHEHPQLVMKHPSNSFHSAQSAHSQSK